MRLGELAAQDQEVGTDGEHFPGGEEGEVRCAWIRSAMPAYISIAEG